MLKNNKQVLQKILSQAGIASRRRAEEMIKQGRVMINGKIAGLGDRADENDDVQVAGKRINFKPVHKYYILNKPEGYTCTTRSFTGEKNIYDLLPDKTLYIAGRLDKDSAGLVLLTNDGELVQKITHPKFQHEKKYLVKINKEANQDVGVFFKKGVNIEGGRVSAKEVVKVGKLNYEITLVEGKKRQIREMFKKLGLRVESLERVSIGKLSLSNLKKGEYRAIKKEEIF